MPSRDAHAPSTRCGRLPLLNCSSSCIISPVGSRGSKDLTSNPAGEARVSMLLPSAACKPSAVKRAGVTAGLRRYRLLNRKARSRSVLTGSPLLTVTNSGSARRRWAICRDRPARIGASVPSMPTRIRREARPSRSWSISNCCSGVGVRGRKADRSAVKCVRLMMAPHASKKASHSAMAVRARR